MKTLGSCENSRSPYASATTCGSVAPVGLSEDPGASWWVWGGSGEGLGERRVWGLGGRAENPVSPAGATGRRSPATASPPSRARAAARFPVGVPEVGMMAVGRIKLIK